MLNWAVPSYPDITHQIFKQRIWPNKHFQLIFFLNNIVGKENPVQICLADFILWLTYTWPCAIYLMKDSSCIKIFGEVMWKLVIISHQPTLLLEKEELSTYVAIFEPHNSYSNSLLCPMLHRLMVQYKETYDPTVFYWC